MLTGKGGVYADKDQSIVAEWKWDRKAQNAGTIPPSGINMPLNKVRAPWSEFTAAGKSPLLHHHQF